MSASRTFLTLVAGSIVATVGCKKNPNPRHIDAAGFETGKQLADTLKYLVGMTEPAAWEAMQGNGFGCAERRYNLIKDGKLQLGDAYLQCSYEHRINFGLRRRIWTVTFPLDSSRVRDVYASSMKQDL
jgi:hypothetical protein